MDQEALRASLASLSSIRLAVLFGSAAKGRQGARSDVDLGVDLDPDTSTTRLEVLNAAGRAVHRDIDLIDLTSAPPLRRFQIARDGKVLIERRPGAWRDFRSRAMIDWWDWAPLARRIHASSVCATRSAVVDLDIVARKIASATARLREVGELTGRPRDAFLADSRGRDLAAFYMQLAVQDCIDLASHWVADAGWQPPDDAGSAFDTLADHSILPRDLASVLRRAVGLRNIIAHGYANLDHGRFSDEVHEAHPLLERYLALLADAAGL